MAKNRTSRNTPLGVLVVFGLFWSGMTLLFDGIFVRNAVHQLRTLTYSTTQGVVAHTDLECISDDEGGSYRPIIKYAYSMTGKEYKGDRRCYDEEGFGPRTARRIMDAYLVGGPVKVHYAPHDPAEAVLQVGLEGIDLFHAMFMLPFNLIMLGFWIAGFGKAYYRLHRPQAGGARMWEDGDKLRVRLVAGITQKEFQEKLGSECSFEPVETVSLGKNHVSTYTVSNITEKEKDLLPEGIDKAKLSFLDGKLYRLAYDIEQVYHDRGTSGPRIRQDCEKVLELILKSLRNKYKELDKGSKGFYLDFVLGTKPFQVTNGRMFEGSGVVVTLDGEQWDLTSTQPGFGDSVINYYSRRLCITFHSTSVVNKYATTWATGSINLRNETERQAKEREARLKKYEEDRLREEKDKEKSFGDKF